jgi:hypothetical protein
MFGAKWKAERGALVAEGVCGAERTMIGRDRNRHQVVRQRTVPKTLALKGTLYSQIIPAAPDIIKLFSLNPSLFSESVSRKALLFSPNAS